MDFWKIFGIDSGDKRRKEFGSLFTRLEAILEGKGEAEVCFIAGLAGLLGKVAKADGEISDEELLEIERILHSQAALSSEQIEAVVSLIRELTDELSGIEDHKYIRMINSFSSFEEKKKIVSALFSAAAANESVCSQEDNTIRVISEGLFLTHTDFIEVRKGFLEHLDVLKGLGNQS